MTDNLPNSDNPYQAPQTQGMNAPSIGSQTSNPYVACPDCGQKAAQQVKWTLWGGALGPKMFTHVKCASCGTKYNGKTGKYNTTAITIYLIISLVIGGLFGWFVLGKMLVR